MFQLHSCVHIKQALTHHTEEDGDHITHFTRQGMQFAAVKTIKHEIEKTEGNNTEISAGDSLFVCKKLLTVQKTKC